MAATMKNKLVIPCIEIEQPIGVFYIASINSKDLLSISFADIRRVEGRDFERYLGIQRQLSKNRVNELKQYVTNVDATFPTSIILAIESKHAYFNKNKGVMVIDKEENVAKIIDGQHRIAGLEDYKENAPFNLNVTIFVDMDIENQAMVFGTINLAQTKVNKSLVYDLFDFAKTRSPQKTCHNITIFLNSMDKSPFKGRIKRLGIASEINQTLTQAAVVEGILRYISGDAIEAMKDRDLLLRGKKLNKITGEGANKLLFRNLFIEERDTDITKIIWNYFSAISNKWPKSWNGVNIPGNILPRTNGYRALMRLLKPIYLKISPNFGIPAESKYIDVLSAVKIKDSDFSSDKYKPGTSGETDLYKEILSMI
jgi:DGQHR domain-containing protein